MSIHGKVRRGRAALLLAVLALLVLLPATALAQTVPGNLEQAVGDVEIPAGMVLQGNVKVGNGHARVFGRVEGNVEVANGAVEIQGEVTGDVRVTNGRVKLGPAARVDGRVVILRGNVDQAPGSQVAGGVEIGQSNGTVTVGTPDGNVIIDEDGIRGPGIYVGEEGIRLPGLKIGPEGIQMPGLSIGPEGIRTPGFDMDNMLMGQFLGHYNPLFVLLRWAGLFALSAVAVAVMPVPLSRMAVALEQHPVRAGLNGLVVVLAIAPAIALLVLTIIGIPVALVGILALIAAKFLGYVALSLWLGEKVGRLLPQMQQSDAHRFVFLLSGSLVLALAAMVPGLDFLVGFLGACLGLGAAWVTRLGTRSWGMPPVPGAPSGPAQA